MHNDKQTYSIYMTIDNLNVVTKRNQTRSKIVQLRFFSIVKSQITTIKTKIYHRAIKIILKRKSRFDISNKLIILIFENLILKKIVMLCVDEHYRYCYSIIMNFKMNYKKQILITSIKNEIQCSICIVFSRRRQNLITK